MSFTFVLVHGHWHGSWAWARLTPHLRELGHHVLTPQLPSDRLECGAAENAQVVVKAIEDHRRGRRDACERIILVGHSAGGLTIPIVAQQVPVLRMVFLAAVLPLPGVSLAEQFDADPGAEVEGFTWISRQDGLLEVSEEVAHRHFFHDCSFETAREATEQLRLQTPATIDEPSPLTHWPSIATDYIVCRRDRVLDPAWQLKLSVERLKTTPIELNSGHSPALSSPRHLAHTLVQLAKKGA